MRLAPVLLAALALASAVTACAAAPRRPNILFVLTDDQRWDALGLAGHKHLKTPHLDRLGREGVYFRNAFCTTSLCSPSRASILSGLYAHTHGVTNNFTEYPAALQSFPVELFLGTGETLSGTSHTTWREHIGNAVPRASSRAIGTEMVRTLLMAAVGHTFALSSAPIWVQPFVAAMSLDRRPFLGG